MKKVLCVISVLLVFCLTGCRPRIKSPAEIIEYIDYAAESGLLELPVAGASGYAAVGLPLYQAPDGNAAVVVTLNAGQGFTILEEKDEWWRVEAGGIDGWIKHQFCMINIPDVIPSIMHDNTNTYSSMFRTSGFDIPNITGMALYNAYDYNERLGREEFIAPVLYGMIGKIFAAQQAALADGNTLIIYEAFRPAQPHERLFENMSYLVKTNPLVRDGVSRGTFRMDLFLAPSPYNHQRGTAIDVSLGKIIDQETRTAGNYKYTYIARCSEYPMQSPMHELSVASAIFKRWVNARTVTGWLSGEFSDSATDAAKLLQKYCTDAGLIPLASEWWHFNDLEWSPIAIKEDLQGDFFIEQTYSREP